MGDYIGVKCPVCDERFHEGEDIVVCPDCGTPHHRACYTKTGRCANEQLHHSHTAWNEESEQRKEEQKYDGSASLRCSKCGTVNPPDGIFCQICGCRLGDSAETQDSGADSGEAPRPITLNAFTTPYGGVSPDEEIDGVCVRDIALFVGENSFYFIPKFKEMFHHQRASNWNWPGFIFRGFYFLYRKMYAVGAAVLAATVLLGLPSLLCNLAYYLSAPVLFGIRIESLNVARIVCNSLSVGLALFCAMGVNRIYYGRVLRTVKRLRDSFGGDVYAKEYILALTKKGRTNRVIITVLLALMFFMSTVLSLLLSMSIF